MRVEPQAQTTVLSVRPSLSWRVFVTLKTNTSLFFDKTVDGLRENLFKIKKKPRDYIIVCDAITASFIGTAAEPYEEKKNNVRHRTHKT